VDRESARTGVLDAAEELFYGRGIQVVGMDDIRAASGVSLKRLYQLFPAKNQLVAEYLERRDGRWRGRLAEYVAGRAAGQGVDGPSAPADRLLAVFDWLALWFAEPGFRGCAWINGFGELGAVSPAVVAAARAHKAAFRDYLRGLAADAGLPADLADQLTLLAEGAMVTAGIFGTGVPAAQARAAAHALITAAQNP
jgi:AcrR family transcriptional regulator